MGTTNRLTAITALADVRIAFETGVIALALFGAAVSGGTAASGKADFAVLAAGAEFRARVLGLDAFADLFRALSGVITRAIDVDVEDFSGAFVPLRGAEFTVLVVGVPRN